MKKQFFRVKQLADQTFSRAGKTDVLSDDLQEADRKVEYIKNSCQNVGKKLSGCLLLGQLQGESGTKEKLMKKSPNYQLGTTMLECGALCDDESLMKTVLNKCGHAEKCISEETAEHDHRVEQHVIAPLQTVVETEIPNIIKQKRNVTKVCLDMDSAKTRYLQAQKHNSNNTAGAAKIESIKDELKESEQKVEQSRDVLACEMFHLAARESELCYTLLQYYKFQKRYHEYALGILDRLIPELENDICSSKTKPVYGVDLEEHLEVTGRKIAFPIELCVCALLELGMEEEGLFRLTGGASKLKRLKLSFDAGCMTLATALAYRDPHVIAGALKSYLRELPEPLLTHSLYDEWLNAAKAQTHPDNKLQSLWTVVHKLPKPNFENLGYLIKFFHVLSKNHEINKMSPHNLAIVIAPSLIWTKDENSGPGFGLNVNVSLYPSIIDLLVTYADWFFDKDMDFYVTLEPIMNGDVEEKSGDKGIDNKGFDLKVADKMHKSAIEKGSGQVHPSGDAEAGLSDISRSQSINCLTDEAHVHDSPKPITRRKNKSVAPVPPVLKDDKKKDDGRNLKDVAKMKKDSNSVSDKPDKPPRPTVTTNSTLPRPSKNRSNEMSLESGKQHPADDIGIARKSSGESERERTSSTSSSSSSQVKVIKTVATVSTNTETYRVSSKETTHHPTNSLERPVAAPRSSLMLVTEPTDKPKVDSDAKKPAEYSKVNLISVKKEWLLGKDSADIEAVPLRKPAVPERPSTLKPQISKFNRASMDVSLRNNYENVSLVSGENPAGHERDDRTNVQKTQVSSVDKQQVSVVEVSHQDKSKSIKIVTETVDNGTATVTQTNATVTATAPTSASATSVEVLKNSRKSESSSDGSALATDGHDDDKDVVVVLVEERKTSTANSSRPTSLPGAEKPERPPKPDYKFSTTSSSHTRTFSDGQIIDIKPSDNNTSNNNSCNVNSNVVVGSGNIINNSSNNSGSGGFCGSTNNVSGNGSHFAKQSVNNNVAEDGVNQSSLSLSSSSSSSSPPPQQQQQQHHHQPHYHQQQQLPTMPSAVIKHPQTSPPPPPVPVKPRANSQSESTDF